MAKNHEEDRRTWDWKKVNRESVAGLFSRGASPSSISSGAGDLQADGDSWIAGPRRIESCDAWMGTAKEDNRLTAAEQAYSAGLIEEEGSEEPQRTTPQDSTLVDPVAATDDFENQFSPLVVGEAGPEITPIQISDRFESARNVPDTVIDGWENKEFVIRAAAVRGQEHRHSGMPRQDAFHVEVSPNGQYIFAAVADGVSSAKLSHKGASTAVRYAVEWLKRSYSSHTEFEGWDDLVKGTAWAVKSLADKSPDNSPMDFATTLVVAVIRRDGGGLAAESVSIGDSGFWKLGKDGIFLHEGGKRESSSIFASSAVSPLPSVPHSIQNSAASSAEEEVLMLGSDGIGDPLGGGGGPLTELLKQRLLGRIPSLIEFAHLVDFSKAGFADDRVLIAIWPK